MRSTFVLGAVLLLSNVLLLLAAQQAEVSHLQETSSASAAADGSLAETLGAVEQLVKVLKEDGAQVNVEVRQAPSHAGLGMFAVRDIKEGDTIVSVPVDQGFTAVAANGVVDFLLDFVLDLHDPKSPSRLMWATTPKPDRLRHLLNFPQQYLPLLQHKELEEWMGQGIKEDVAKFCELHKEILAAAKISAEDVTHALGLIGTRTFSRPHPEGQLSIFHALPLLDMANHDNACLHYNTFAPCQFDPTRECAFFTAGADIKAGDEVCYWYGHLLPDRAFLEYGFLPKNPAAPKPTKKARKPAAKLTTAPEATKAADPQATGSAAAGAAKSGEPAAAASKRNRSVRKSRAAEAQAPPLPLFGIDRHDYDSSEPLVKLVQEPRPFTGNITSITARIEKLQQLHDTLKAGDALAAEIAAQGPAPGDEGGAFLQQLQQWRLQRQQAVSAEVERLKKIKTTHQIRGALSATRRRR